MYLLNVYSVVKVLGQTEYFNLPSRSSQREGQKYNHFQNFFEKNKKSPFKTNGLKIKKGSNPYKDIRIRAKKTPTLSFDNVGEYYLVSAFSFAF